MKDIITLISKFVRLILNDSVWGYLVLERTLGAHQGPSINDVGPFFRFYDPLSPSLSSFYQANSDIFELPPLPLPGDVVYGWPLAPKVRSKTKMVLHQIVCAWQHDFSCEISILGIQDQDCVWLKLARLIKEIIIFFEIEECQSDKND